MATSDLSTLDGSAGGVAPGTGGYLAQAGAFLEAMQLEVLQLLVQARGAPAGGGGLLDSSPLAAGGINPLSGVSSYLSPPGWSGFSPGSCTNAACTLEDFERLAMMGAGGDDRPGNDAGLIDFSSVLSQLAGLMRQAVHPNGNGTRDRPPIDPPLPNRGGPDKCLGFLRSGSGGSTLPTSQHSSIAANKSQINQALDRAGATQGEKAIVMAIGMQETRDMSSSERDCSKDGGSAQNVSCFNLNTSMLKDLGYQGQDNGASLNDPKNLQSAVNYMLKGIRQWGPEKFLDYQRGGSTGFKDGCSYDCSGYRQGIQAMATQLLCDPSLMTDDRRVDRNTQHE